MKLLIVAAALALLMISAPLMAQNTTSGNPSTGFTRSPGTGMPPGTGVRPGFDAGPGNTTGSTERMQSEIERRRSDDLQRGVRPMTADPRLGPPSAPDTGGLGRVPGQDTGTGLQR